MPNTSQFTIIDSLRESFLYFKNNKADGDQRMPKKSQSQRRGRFVKLRKGSDGYKKGYRYVDFGATSKSKSKPVKKLPKSYRYKDPGRSR